MWWKNCFCLPEVGIQNATFSPDFTQPGKSLLEIPCIYMEKSRNLSYRFSAIVVKLRLSVDVGETAGMEYRSPPLVCSVNTPSFLGAERFPFGVDDSSAVFGIDFEPLGPQ